MVDLRTRPSTPDDLSFLRALHHAAYRDVVTRQFGVWDEEKQDESFLRDLASSRFEIVESSGEPIGAIGSVEAADCIQLAELWILPAWQNHGIGSSILRGLQEHAKAAGKWITLRVLHQNRARALYERHGFTVVGETDTVCLMEWRPRQDSNDPE